jgi:hypothetical protein
MKKTILVFFLLISGQMVIAGPGDKNDGNKDKTELTEAQLERLSEMESRVNEIKAMDFREISKDERKEIREELKSMKAEARENGNGIYLSVGAIIVILLILILII